MANGIGDLQDLYDFGSFGGTVTSPGQSEEMDKFIDKQGRADQIEENNDKNEKLVGGIPLKDTLVTSPEVTKALLNIHDSYNTNYSASDFSDVDFLGEETRADMLQAGQIDEDELNEFLDEFIPGTKKEDIDELFPKEDFKFEKRLALAKLGLNLMQPTMGGSIGAVVANAGKELTTDLASIQAAKRKGERERRAAIFNAEKEEQAARLNLATQVFLQNEQNEFNMQKEIFSTNASMAEKYAKALNENNKNRQEVLKEEMKNRYKTDVDDFMFIDDNGELVGPLYGVVQDNNIFVPHPTAVDDDGYPVMVNYKSLGYNEPTTTDVTSDASTKGDGITSANKFIDLKNEVDNYDRVIDMALNVQKSLTLNPQFAGFTGAFLSFVQDKLQIVKDFRTGFFDDDARGRLNKAVKEGKFAGSLNTKSENLLLPTDLIDGEGGAAKFLINGEEVQILDDASAQALSDATTIAYQIMQDDIEALEQARKDGKDTITLAGGIELGGQEADDLFGLLQYQKDLPLNEAASTAIIYALARARKASGRLNKDDIERAAATLNLYGESSKGVITKLDFVIDELKDAAASQISTSILLYGSTGKPQDQALVRKYILQRIRSGKALPLVFRNQNELIDLGFTEGQVKEILEGYTTFREYQLPEPGQAPQINPDLTDG